MSKSIEAEIAGHLSWIISDAFNRSINALEDAGAIDTKQLRKHYKGIGSKYYDVVTEQIEITIQTAAPLLTELFTQVNASREKE